MTDLLLTISKAEFTVVLEQWEQETRAPDGEYTKSIVTVAQENAEYLWGKLETLVQGKAVATE